MWISIRFVTIALAALLLLPRLASAQDIVIPLEGFVDEGPETHFFLPFEVPDGIREIEVRHDDLSRENILDWGLDDPNGFRGWGGGNRENAIVGVEAASRSYVPGAIPSGTWEVVVGKAKVNERPARYAVEIILRTEPTLEPQTERSPYEEPSALSEGPRWYAGDLHVHSRESGDARPSIDENLSFAASRGLDFILGSEHNTNSQLSLYNAAQADHPTVLLIPGMEFTTYAGHANAIGTTEWVDHRIGVRGATIEAAIQAFHDQGGLFSINHPDLRVGDLCIGCGWDHVVDPLAIDAVEVRTGFLPGTTFWENLIAQGSRAAAIGGSDDHRAGQDLGPIDSPIGRPTTMVYADELSVEAIVRGIADSRTVVKAEGPDGPMIEMELSGRRRGDTVSALQSTLRATVTGADGNLLRFIKNGATLAETTVIGDAFVYEVIVDAPASGQDRYRSEIANGDSIRTLTSYVWLQALAEDEDDSGCSMTAPARQPSWPWLPLFGAVALAIARSARRR